MTIPQHVPPFRWYFGGGSLRTALLHPKELDADVIYYGGVVTDASELEGPNMPVQDLLGADTSNMASGG